MCISQNTQTKGIINFLLSALKRKPKWSDLLEHSWNPNKHFLCPSNMQEISTLKTDKQRETLQPWRSVEAHPLPSLL